MALIGRVFRQCLSSNAKLFRSRSLSNGPIALTYCKLHTNWKTSSTVPTNGQRRRISLVGAIRAADSHGNGRTKPDVTYEELVSLIESSNIQLFDVREPKELESTGQIPNAINIPLSKLKTFLSQSSTKELDEAFNVSKPKKEDQNIVFYGLKDVKGAAALEIAHKLGFKRARHYPGGWMEWEEKHSNK